MCRWEKNKIIEKLERNLYKMWLDIWNGVIVRKRKTIWKIKIEFKYNIIWDMKWCCHEKKKKMEEKKNKKWI